MFFFMACYRSNVSYSEPISTPLAETPKAFAESPPPLQTADGPLRPGRRPGPREPRGVRGGQKEPPARVRGHGPEKPGPPGKGVANAPGVSTRARKRRPDHAYPRRTSATCVYAAM